MGADGAQGQHGAAAAGRRRTLWGQLDRSVRNQVRKAERAGLSVEFGGVEMLDEFYRFFAARMRDLGSPVHAREFFRATLDAFGNRARVALVRKGQTPIGGLIALAFKDSLAGAVGVLREGVFRALSQHASVLGDHSRRVR